TGCTRHLKASKLKRERQGYKSPEWRDTVRFVYLLLARSFGVVLLVLSLSGWADSLQGPYVVSGPRTNGSGTDKGCIANKSTKSGSKFFLVNCSTVTRETNNR